MKLALQLVGVFGFAVLVAGGNFLWGPEPPPWRAVLPSGHVEIETVMGWSEEPLWVDAREPTAFNRGHVPGAVNLEPADLDANVGELIAQWTPGRAIVVYCSAECDAAAEVAGRLRNEFAMEQVWVLSGGWSAWKSASQP